MYLHRRYFLLLFSFWIYKSMQTNEPTSFWPLGKIDWYSIVPISFFHSKRGEMLFCYWIANVLQKLHKKGNTFPPALFHAISKLWNPRTPQKSKNNSFLGTTIPKTHCENALCKISHHDEKNVRFLPSGKLWELKHIASTFQETAGTWEHCYYKLSLKLSFSIVHAECFPWCLRGRERGTHTGLSLVYII